MRRLKLIGLRAGWGPFAAEMRIAKSERDLLHPLFVILRDKRALFYTAQCRANDEQVTQSIEAIRQDLTFALQALGPDAVVAGELELLRRACREYLDVIAESHSKNPDGSSTALEQLRESFCEVATSIASDYDLPSANELVEEMNPHSPPCALSPEQRAAQLALRACEDRRDNALWSMQQLAEFERMFDARAIWILGTDFLTDMAGMPFYEAIRHNILQRDIAYAYVAPDQPTARHQLTSLRRALKLADDDKRMVTVFLDKESWRRLPYTAGNVSIYHPQDDEHLPDGFFWYPGGDGECFGHLGDYVVLRWIGCILQICPELSRATRTMRGHPEQLSLARLGLNRTGDSTDA